MPFVSSPLVARWRLPVLLLLLLAGGCLCGGEGVNEGDVNLISLEEEWRMGDVLARQVRERLLTEERLQAARRQVQQRPAAYEESTSNETTAARAERFRQVQQRLRQLGS